jgi:hypothetical protein
MWPDSSPIHSCEPKEARANRAEARAVVGRIDGKPQFESAVSSGIGFEKPGQRWYVPNQPQALFRSWPTVSTEKYQLEIVKADGLTPLLRLLHSSYLPLILSAAACVRNVSIHPANESPIIDSGFLQPLIELLSFDENEEVQCHAISTLRNLAASSERNKTAIVEAGAVERIKQLVLTAPLVVQSEMTACVAVLALSGKFPR